MEFTLWISPVLNAAHPSSGGRTMITLGHPWTSSLPGRLGDRGDAPQWPTATHTPGIRTLFGLKSVCSLPRIHLPDADAMNESLGEVVMNAVDIIPNTHLRLVRTLFRELFTDKDLLTVAAAYRVNPMLVVAVTETPFIPWPRLLTSFYPGSQMTPSPLRTNTSA